MAKILSTFAVLFSLLSTTYAQAETNVPAGVTVVHLQESASQKVAQDRIRASLRLEKENYDVSRLQNSINKIMKDAISKAQKIEGIEINTGTYTVYKSYKDDGKDEIWTGQQTLELEGSDKAEILELVADLQSLGFAQNSLNYVISSALYQEWRNTLMERAISNIQDRAKSVSNQLKLNNIRIAELNLQDHLQQPPVQHHRMMAMAEKVQAAPVLESSGEVVKITVRAKVYLKAE